MYSTSSFCLLWQWESQKVITVVSIRLSVAIFLGDDDFNYSQPRVHNMKACSTCLKEEYKNIFAVDNVSRWRSTQKIVGN